ncbi:hypothetical protein LZ31DRAFT_114342 [Colletotrichum somersetense]|nr:hypothetical protein LZ31DRAFT_114342 [Colletotrichum somersetense]
MFLWSHDLDGITFSRALWTVSPVAQGLAYLILATSPMLALSLSLPLSPSLQFETHRTWSSKAAGAGPGDDHVFLASITTHA